MQNLTHEAAHLRVPNALKENEKYRRIILGRGYFRDETPLEGFELDGFIAPEHAQKLCDGWNLLNRLDELGITAEQVPGIIEALREISTMGITECEGGEACNVARAALAKKS